jgi:hypothetical protein
MERKKYFSNILGSQFDKFCTSKRGVGERRLSISSWDSFSFRNYSLHCNSISRHSCFCRQNCCHYLKQNRGVRSTLVQPSLWQPQMMLQTEQLLPLGNEETVFFIIGHYWRQPQLLGWQNSCHHSDTKQTPAS